MMSELKSLLLSLLAILGAALSLALVTSVASWLPGLLQLHPGSAALLGWDLVFSILGGICAIGFATYHAPRWPRTHGAAIWLMLVGAALWACWDSNSLFPYWFITALLVSLPLQLYVGLRIGARRSRSATSL